VTLTTFQGIVQVLHLINGSDIMGTFEAKILGPATKFNMEAATNVSFIVRILHGLTSFPSHII
jgi:hypothetical protein